MNKTKTCFLGGTCNGSNWRDLLKPMLNIRFYDPVVSDWNEEAQKEEIRQRETCDYCLYVITPKMTGTYSIAEVADDSNKRPKKTVFCFLDKDDDKEFEKFQIKSLNQVSKLIVKNGAKAFDTLQEVADFLNK